MSMVTPDLARAVHDDRRRRLLAEAEARRVRRELAAARRAERPVRRPGGWLRDLVRRGHHVDDAKIARLADSWLELDDRAATLLARAADEIDVPAGAVLVPGRFSYIGLDDAHRGLLVTTGTPPATIESPATVLVLTTDDLETVRPAVPLLTTARPHVGPAPLTLHDPFEPAGRAGEVVRGRVARPPAQFAPAFDIVGELRAVAGGSRR